MEQIFLFISSTFNFQLSTFSFQLKEKPHLYTKGGEKQYKDYEKNSAFKLYIKRRLFLNIVKNLFFSYGKNKCWFKLLIHLLKHRLSHRLMASNVPFLKHMVSLYPAAFNASSASLKHNVSSSALCESELITTGTFISRIIGNNHVAG